MKLNQRKQAEALIYNWWNNVYICLYTINLYNKILLLLAVTLILSFVNISLIFVVNNSKYLKLFHQVC